MIFIVLFSVSILKPGYADIVASPKDVEAVIGASVVFSCSSSMTGADVQWNVIPVGKPMHVVYAYGKINNLYSNRVTVQDGHNLHISSVVEGDAGTYECVEDYGKGDRKSAELVILGIPSCSSNSDTNEIVGKNVCGFEPDQVTLSCIVQFQGHKDPIMEWKKNGEQKPITSGVSNETRGNIFLLNLTMKGDSMANGSSYTCGPAKALSSATTCNSGIFTVKGESSGQCWLDVVISYGYICLIIIASLLTTSVATDAGTWYLFIHRPQEKVKEGQEEPESEPLKTEKPPEDDEADNEFEPSSNPEGRRSPCKCCKDAFIFVLTMAIPFGLGLILWFRCVYRKVEKKIDEGEKHDGELAIFLARPREMKAIKKSVKKLKSKNQSLEQDNANLRRENQNLNTYEFVTPQVCGVTNKVYIKRLQV